MKQNKTDKFEENKVHFYIEIWHKSGPHKWWIWLYVYESEKTFHRLQPNWADNIITFRNRVNSVRRINKWKKYVWWMCINETLFWKCTLFPAAEDCETTKKIEQADGTPRGHCRHLIAENSSKKTGYPKWLPSACSVRNIIIWILD